MDERDKQKDLEARRLHKTLLQDQEPEQKYESKRRQITDVINNPTYWPEGMRHPADYRGFYWTDDLAFCGFATLDCQKKTAQSI